MVLADDCDDICGPINAQGGPVGQIGSQGAQLERFIFSVCCKSSTEDDIHSIVASDSKRRLNQNGRSYTAESSNRNVGRNMGQNRIFERSGAKHSPVGACIDEKLNTAPDAIGPAKLPANNWPKISILTLE